MTQGFVLTQYFYEQMIQFEKDQASLKDTIGEMVYSMDVEQQVHRARQIDFDKEADGDVLQRSKPRKLTGLDLAEAQAGGGRRGQRPAPWRNRRSRSKTDSRSESVADSARADFILARVAMLTGHPGAGDRRLPEDPGHQQGAAAAGLVAHLSGPDAGPGVQARRGGCGVQRGLAVRDGQQDTRLAAERGIKTAYAVKGHSCDEDAMTIQPAPGQPEPRPDLRTDWYAEAAIAPQAPATDNARRLIDAWSGFRQNLRAAAANDASREWNC